MALYPRFDHHAGAFRLLAAVFTRGAVPVPTPSPQSPSSSSDTSQRKIAPLPLKRLSAKVATGMNAVPNGAPADASSLLNVHRPFGDGTNGKLPTSEMINSHSQFGPAPPQAPPTQPPMVPVQAAGVPQPQMMYNDVTMSMQQSMQPAMPDGVPNGYNGYGYSQGFDPSFNAMAAPQMQPDFAYYGMQPQTGYPQAEDTVMTSSQPYTAPGTIWNMQ